MKRSLGILSVVALLVTSVQLHARWLPSEAPIGCISKQCIPKTSDVVPYHVGSSWSEGDRACYCISKKPKLPMGPGIVITKQMAYSNLRSNNLFIRDVVKSNAMIPSLKKSVQLLPNKYGVCVFVPTHGTRGGWVGCTKSLAKSGSKAWRVQPPLSLHCFSGMGTTRTPVGFDSLGSIKFKGQTCQLRVPTGPLVK